MYTYLSIETVYLWYMRRARSQDKLHGCAPQRGGLLQKRNVIVGENNEGRRAAGPRRPRQSSVPTPREQTPHAAAPRPTPDSPRGPRHAAAVMTDPLQNSILRISDEKTMQLLTLYEQESCLWDTSKKEYRSRDYRARHNRAKAAERIARKLRIKNFESKHVMIKFKNLRNSYCQELKKIAASKYAGKGDEVYQPRVCWFHKMDSFLRPHVQCLTMSLPFANEEPDKEEEGGHTIQALQSTSTQPAQPVKPIIAPSLKDTEIKSEIIVDEDEWLQQAEDDIRELVESNIRPSSSSDEDAPLVKKKRPGKRHGHGDKQGEGGVGPSEQVPSRVLQDIAAQLEVLSGRRDDALDAFGRYVASLLRGMPPARAAALQPRVVALLTAADDDTLVTQSDQII